MLILRALLALFVFLSLCSLPAHAQEALAQALAKLPPALGKPVVHPRKGKESLYRLARKHGLSRQAVYNANPGSLKAGGELLLLPTQHLAPLAKANGLVINLPERNAYFYRDGKPLKVFPIAIGRRGFETPVGNFRIINKRKHPTWFPPEWAHMEKPVPPGPENPLGDRWMGTSAPGIGLHATNSPPSVGRVTSHGCMRMYPEHAHELYNLVKIGTPVKIIYQLASLGYDPAEGLVLLAHYTNPYDRPKVTLEDLRKQLAAFGLEDVSDFARIEETLSRTRGLPVPIVGSRVKVVVDGAPVKFALAPVRENDEWLVPVGPLAEALGAILEIGPEAEYVLLVRGEQALRFLPGDFSAQLNGEPLPLGAPLRLAAGYPLVPLRATLTALGASLGWDNASKTLLIWDEGGPQELLPLP